MKRSRLNAVLAAYISIGMLMVVILSVTGLTLRSALLSGIVLALLLPVGVRAATGRLDIFEPLVLANIALAVMFVGRPITDLVTGKTNHLGYNVMPTFDKALFVAFVGILFFQLGYLSPFGRAWARALPAAPSLRPHRVALMGWSYLVLGTVLFGEFLSRAGGIGLLLVLLQGRQESNNALFLGSTGYLYNGILLWGASALIFFALAVACKRRIYWFWFLLPTLALLIFYGARGTRSMLLPLVIAVPVFWYLWHAGRPRARTVLVVGLIGVALLGWLRDVRTAGENRDFINALVAALSSPVSEVGDIFGGADADMFDSLANELQIVPEQTPFQHGATITDVFIRAVPRPMWPSKPLESNDVLVNALWPAHYAVSRAASAFSLIGIFYADTGYITVALGMFLIGIVLSMSWRWLLRYQVQPVAQMIYAMELPFVIILMRGTIPDTLTRMFFLFVPLALMTWLTRLRFGTWRTKSGR